MLGTYLSGDGFERLKQGAASSAEPRLRLDRPRMSSDYNRRPLLVHHGLADHPAFQLPPLFDLCRRLPASEVKLRVDKVPADTHFDSSLSRATAAT